MNWWQWCLLLLGIGTATWLIPAVILGYALGGAAESAARDLNA